MQRILRYFLVFSLGLGALPACDSGTGPGPRPPAVAAVEVTPKEDSLQVGGTRQLTSSVKDAAGNVLAGRRVTWATSDSGVARVDTLGLVTALASGTATVSATAEGVRGTATLRVAPKGPVVRILGPAGDTTVGAFTVSLSVDARHDVRLSGLAVSVNGAPETPVTAPECLPASRIACAFLVRGLREGENTLVVAARDTAGVRGEAAVRVVSRVPTLAYRMTFLRTPDGASIHPHDVNEKGEVAGSAAGADGEPRPFLWSGGVATGLGTAGGTNGVAVAVNDRGDVVGTVGGNGPGVCRRAVLWRGGAAETVRCGTGLDVDRPGAVLFSSGDTVYVRSGGADSVLYVTGLDPYGLRLRLEGPARFNDRRRLAVTVASNDLVPGDVLLVEAGRATGICGFCAVADLNEAGDAALRARPSDIRHQGAKPLVVWRGGSSVSLGILDRESRAWGMNDRGEVVGLDGVGAFLWRNGGFSLVRPAEAGWELSEVRGINNAGQIIAVARNTSTRAEVGVLLDPVS